MLEMLPETLDPADPGVKEIAPACVRPTAIFVEFPPLYVTVSPRVNKVVVAPFEIPTPV